MGHRGARREQVRSWLQLLCRSMQSLGPPNRQLLQRMDEARRRLEKFGPNAMPDTALHPLRLALEKFWAPVPWMLEAAIVLELALGKYVEAAIIAALLVFNAALGLFQESRAQATLAALKSRLALNASVRRDGRSCQRPSWCRAMW
jgi:magnesium-transporting ATPase (P-type)